MKSFDTNLQNGILSNRMLYADDSFAIDFRAIDVNSVELAVLIE